MDDPPRPLFVSPGVGPPWDMPEVRQALRAATISDIRESLSRYSHGHYDAGMAVHDSYNESVGHLSDECVNGARGSYDMHNESSGTPSADRADRADRAPTSAVLLALYEEDGEIRAILTRRSTELRHHAGEVCFPGGGIERGEDTVQAALREAREEIGLCTDEVEIIGVLPTLHTYSSGSAIAPVVAALPARPEVAANSAEVARLFDIGLGALLDDGVFHEELWKLKEDDPGISVYFFYVAGEVVWGATARIVMQLLTILGDWCFSRNDMERR